MLQKFFKYIFQSMAGMLGISVYILADSFFISVYSGADGLAVLNLILPVYGLIYAIGAMIGIGSATRYAIDRARGKSTSFYFLSAVTWDILISIPLVLAGIFIPDKILQLLGADAGLSARPVVTAGYGAGADGVATYTAQLGNELADTMRLCGAPTLDAITRDMVRVIK